MENIIVYPKNKKQQTLLRSLLKEMNVRFEIEEDDDTRMTKEEFYAEIEEAKQEAGEGKVLRYTPELKKELFGDIL